MSYSKICVEIWYKFLSLQHYTFVVQFFSMLVCMYMYIYMFSIYQVFLSLLSVGNHC